jgi:hypothetical protein
MKIIIDYLEDQFTPPLTIHMTQTPILQELEE